MTSNIYNLTRNRALYVCLFDTLVNKQCDVYKY